MKLNCCIFCFFFLFLSHHVSAQPYFDLTGINYFKNIVSNNNIKANLEAINGFINIPIRNDSDYTIFSLGYDHLAIVVQTQEKYSLSGYRFSVSRIHKWSSGWLSVFVFNARSNSGLPEVFSSDNFQFGGAFVSTKKLSNRFKYSFGLYYNQEQFGPFFVPLAGINWSVTPDFRIFGLLPNNFYLDYRIIKPFHVGFNFSFVTSSFRLEQNQYFRYNENQIRLYLNWIVGASHVLFMESGHSIGRKFTKGNVNSSSGSTLDYNFDQGWIIKMGYTYRIFD